MRFSVTFTAAALAFLAVGAHADVCFTVLDSGGRVLHQSRRAPVDMSRPISETLYSRFPGASLMVFGTNNDVCEETQATPAQRTAAQTASQRRNRRM